MRICKKCTRDVGTYLFCPHCGTNQSTSSLTLGQVYSDWSALYYRKIGKKTREGYENAWKTLRMLEHLEMLDITVHDYQAAMDTVTTSWPMSRKERWSRKRRMSRSRNR